MKARGIRKDMLAASATVLVEDDSGAAPARFCNVTVRNISPGGALLEIPLAGQDSARFPGNGQRIQLRTSLLVSPAVDATVVWEHHGVDALVIGIDFHPLTEKDRAAVEAYMKDRRHALRQLADFQAWLALPGEESREAIVDNISVTGAQVAMNPEDVDSSKLAPGTGVVFRFQYMFIEMMECHGIVAWLHKGQDELQLGIHFVDLKDSDLRLIERFVG